MISCYFDAAFNSTYGLMAENGFLLPPREFAEIYYLEEHSKPRLLRDVCTLCTRALVYDSLLHMLPHQI